MDGCGLPAVAPQPASNVAKSQYSERGLAVNDAREVERREIARARDRQLGHGQGLVNRFDATPRWQQWAVPVAHHHAVMLGMRLTEVWLWPEPFAETSSLPVALRYRDAFSQPPKWRADAAWFEWDGDRWWINAVGHSLFGSELYLAARRCEVGVLPSFALAAVSSAAWEYGYEANGVRPSALDLVYTPISGLVLGEFRHWAYRGAERISNGPLRALVRGLMDPFGDAERAFGAPC